MRYLEASVRRVFSSLFVIVVNNRIVVKGHGLYETNSLKCMKTFCRAKNKVNSHIYSMCF